MIKRYDIDSIDNRDPRMIELGMRLFDKMTRWYFRSEVKGLERVPKGAGLFVANHNAGMLSPDTYLFCAALYRKLGLDEVPYGLGHEVAISLPLLHQFIVPLGAVRASHENAHKLFEKERKVLVYPGGDLDSVRPFRHRNRIIFGPRRGYIKLALREGVPIIPVVAAGAHSTMMVLDDGRWLAELLRLDRWLRMKVCPIALSIPWGLTVGMVPPHIPWRTRILIDILEPIHFDAYGPDKAEDLAYVESCHDLVHSRMEGALQRLLEERKSF